MRTRTRRNDWLPTAASLPRGDLSAMKVHSAAFLRDVEAKPDSPEAVVAHRAAGIARRFGGSISKRGNVLSRLWPCFRAGHDNSLAFPFGHDVGVAAMPCLGLSCGCCATSGARFHSSATVRQGLWHSPMSAHAHGGLCMQQDRDDAT